ELRREDVAARLGGDEFLVLLSSLGTDEAEAGKRAVTVAERLRTAICTPVSMGGTKLSVGCSIGVTVFPKAGSPDADPLWEADTAMYIAKRRGTNEIELYREGADGEVHAPEGERRAANR
ncbi:MAG: GGDEF domain-containing protein, partial [Myxococcales bacterium]|nr:GGDEF domain-containing protein [Myxococcales bacterium]